MRFSTTSVSRVLIAASMTATLLAGCERSTKAKNAGPAADGPQDAASEMNTPAGKAEADAASESGTGMGQAAPGAAPAAGGDAGTP